MDRAPARAQPRKAICAGLDPEGPGQMRSYGAKLPPLPHSGPDAVTGMVAGGSE